MATNPRGAHWLAVTRFADQIRARIAAHPDLREQYLSRLGSLPKNFPAGLLSRLKAELERAGNPKSS